MRLFVAVWPPPPVVEVLAALERPAVEGVRWTGPDQWHVTLRFLGDVADVDVPVAEQAVLAAARAVEPASVALAERTSRFGRAVLHVSVVGLQPWAAAVDEAFHRTGLGGADGRRFVGHVTLARAAGNGPGRVPLPSGTPVPPGPRRWVAEELTLVRSHLGAGPARYETVRRAVAGDHPHTNTRSQLR